MKPAFLLPRTAGLLVVATTFAACTPDLLPPGPQLGSLSTDSVHGPPAGARPFCERLRWFYVCSIPELSDDGRLRVADRMYGPYAWVVPAQDLVQRSHENHFRRGSDYGVLAGAVWVDTMPGPLPATYTDLNLRRGFNCVYLRSGGTWTAFVVAAQPMGPPCPEQHSLLNSLPVRRTHTPGFQSHADVLPVARFHETAPPARRPYFGLKCGNAWCFIGIGPGVEPARPAHYGTGNANIDWVVPGRYDAQDVALRNGNTLVPSGLDASVIAGPAAAFRDPSKFAERVHAATVYFAQQPLGKYADKSPGKWGFEQGPNRIFLQLAGGDWHAWVDNGKEPMRKVRVRRFDHGVYPPPTARFRWDEADENVWVACDDGCCYVSDT